jgi:hypothetical protein
MIEMVDVIVSLLFLPVTIFTIIPLFMLCCQLSYRMFMIVFLKRDSQKQNHHPEELVIHAALNKEFS